MFINNKSIKEFNMKINFFSYQPANLIANVTLLEKSMRPAQGKKLLTLKNMVLVAEFISKKDISNFIAELYQHEENLLDIDDGYLYHCWNADLSAPVDEIAKNLYRISIPFLVLQTLSRQEEKLNMPSNEIINLGNIESECIYEITANTTTEFMIDNINIKSLEGNRTLVIDGINKLVYYKDEPEISKFDLTDLKSFPKLPVGKSNIIRTEDSTVSCLLSYYPVVI